MHRTTWRKKSFIKLAVFYFCAVLLVTTNNVRALGPPVYANLGSNRTIYWAVSGATSCTGLANPAVGQNVFNQWNGGNYPGSGSANLGPFNVAGTFNFLCDAGGGLSDTATIVVCNSTQTATANSCVSAAVTPVVSSLTATPPTIAYNTSSTLNWTVSNSPTSCTATGFNHGGQLSSGSVGTGNLTSTQTYSLQCSNAAGTGAIQNVTVTVCPAGYTVSRVGRNNRRALRRIDIARGSGAMRVAYCTLRFCDQLQDARRVSSFRPSRS